MNKLLAGALLVASLAACGSAPTRLYSLQPIASSSAPVSYQGAPVRVAAVNFPADLDRTEILVAHSDGETRISDLDHWAAPLSKLAQQTLSADLVSRLPPGKVAFPRLPASAAVAELRIDILRMPSRDGLNMAGSWQLAVDSHVELAGVVNLPDQVLAGTAADACRHLSALLARLADQISAELPQAAAVH